MEASTTIFVQPLDLHSHQNKNVDASPVTRCRSNQGIHNMEGSRDKVGKE